MKRAAVVIVLLGLPGLIIGSGCKEPEEAVAPDESTTDPSAPDKAGNGQAAVTEAQEDAGFRGKSVPPGFPSDLFFIEGAEVYDGLSVKIDKGQTAYSLRYSVKKKLGDVSEHFNKVLTEAKFDVEVEAFGPQLTLKFKQGELLQGKINVLPTSQIDEVDVQVLLVK